jgi:hypothetical protein
MELFSKKETERESLREAWSKLPKKTRRERERERERERDERPPLVRREREGRKTTKETGKLIVSKSNLPVFGVFTSFYSFWVK